MLSLLVYTGLEPFSQALLLSLNFNLISSLTFPFNQVGIVGHGLAQWLMIKVAIYFTCVSPFLMMLIYFLIMLITLHL